MILCTQMLIYNATLIETKAIINKSGITLTEKRTTTEVEEALGVFVSIDEVRLVFVACVPNNKSSIRKHKSSCRMKGNRQNHEHAPCVSQLEIPTCEALPRC